MSRYDELRDLVASVESDIEKFYVNGNKAAGTRVRKAMLELRNLASDIRKEIQEIKNKE